VIARCSRGKNMGCRYIPLITITNTDDNFIFACANILKSLDIPHYVYAKRLNGGIGKRPCRDIIIRGHKRCDKFLKEFIPYLKTKKEQANLMRKFIDYRFSVPMKQPYGEYEKNFQDEMKKLNKIPRDYTPNTDSSDDIVRSHMKV
jgi:hypothetical protein